MREKHREDLTVEQEEAVLVGVKLPEDPQMEYPEPLSELRGLAQTAGARVVGGITQRRQRPDQTTYLGKGKVEELHQMVTAQSADVVIFDNELQPAQVRNLEKQTGAKVIDRTELILDIFATRARTLQARLQVELAQLEYARPRLKRMWSHLERLGGGIGTRGPGEQQIETDRRLIDKKIRDLKERLAVIGQRKKREVDARRHELLVSLVGYTNAGKSTLMRRLTGADVYVADKLFATLDTRTKQWLIPGWGKILLSDTVGFIRNLPHDLVASFKATLEEAVSADLLLHVVDAAHPGADEQIEAVNRVLEEIDCRDKPSILVLNQIDRLEDLGRRQALLNLHPHAVAISAHTGEGIDELCRQVAEVLSHRFAHVTVTLPLANGKLLAYLRSHGQIERETFTETDATLALRIAKHLLDRVDPHEFVAGEPFD